MEGRKTQPCCFTQQRSLNVLLEGGKRIKKEAEESGSEHSKHVSLIHQTALLPAGLRRSSARGGWESWSPSASPVSWQRPHLSVHSSKAPVFVLSSIRPSVLALPHKQGLRHLLARTLIVWVAAITGGDEGINTQRQRTDFLAVQGWRRRGPLAGTTKTSFPVGLLWCFCKAMTRILY